MRTPSAVARYSTTAIVLHWAVAILILAGFPLGLYMHDLPISPAKLKLYSYHKWIGITVLGLACARLAWRAGHRPPPPVPMPAWQARAAAAAHLGLYLLMLATPLAGWLMSSALGFKVVWLGVLPLPDLVGKDKALGEALKAVHQGLAFALAAIVAVHAAAALEHHFRRRDGTLARMLPGAR
jgi:cytochrome b561